MTENTPSQKNYTTKEAAEIVGIKERSIQHRCKRDNVRKKDNKYLITDSLLVLWKDKEAKTNAMQTQSVTTNAMQTQMQLDVEIESLKSEVLDLKEELKKYEVGENERIEVFSIEDYTTFEQRLKDWHTLQKDIEYQQQIFNARTEGNEQVIAHYKKQFEYQKEQSTRILDIHEKLIETVNSQSKITLQRTFIEAKEKGYDKD